LTKNGVKEMRKKSGGKTVVPCTVKRAEEIGWIEADGPGGGVRRCRRVKISPRLSPRICIKRVERACRP